MSAIEKVRKIKSEKQSADNQKPPAATPRQTGSYNSLIKVFKTPEGNFKGCQILQTGLVKLLQDLGFRRYDKADRSFVVVRIKDNIIEELSLPDLRVEVVKYYSKIDEDDLMEKMDCPHAELMEKLYRSLGSLLCEEKMSLLVDLEAGNEFNLCKDDVNTGYYFYRNGFVKVTKDEGVVLCPYSELPGLVWNDQILKRDFKKLPVDEIVTAHFYKFLENVAHTKGMSKEVNDNRLASLMSIAGYNLHRFFDRDLQATILLDARKSDDPDGRSGKSMFCKALRHIMNRAPDTGAQCRIIDGKTFQEDNRFKFEELSHNTRLVVFDDIKRGVKIEDFFNAIPDGISVERKGTQGKERVHAKIMFTLNYTLSIRGGSAKDRVIEFEFADYYSSKYKPVHEFGHYFFRDWDEQEWLKFDNVMMWCVDFFMKSGVIQCGTVNLNERKLKDQTCQEFVTYMEDIVIEHQKEYDKRELYKKFVDLDDEGKIRNKDLNWMKMRTFTSFLRDFAEYRDEIAGYKTRRSNGADLIMFFYNQPVHPDNLVDAHLFPEKAGLCTPTATEPGEPAASGDLPF